MSRIATSALWLLSLVVALMIFGAENSKKEACENLSTWVSGAESKAIAICEVIPAWFWDQHWSIKLGIVFLPIVALNLTAWAINKRRQEWVSIERASREIYDDGKESKSAAWQMIAHGDEPIHGIAMLLFLYAKSSDVDVRARHMHGISIKKLSPTECEKLVVTQSFGLCSDGEWGQSNFNRVPAKDEYVDVQVRRSQARKISNRIKKAKSHGRPVHLDNLP